MRDACEGMEALLGGRLEGFDAIGLCFPDVVVRGRIVGGETPKTQGMRENRALDYETEFAKLAGLCERLRAYAREGGAVLNTNDGPMAAFTSAVEQAAAGAELSLALFRPHAGHGSGHRLGAATTAASRRCRWRSTTSSSTWAALASALVRPGRRAQRPQRQHRPVPARCKSAPGRAACSAWGPNTCPSATQRRMRACSSAASSRARANASSCLPRRRTCARPPRILHARGRGSFFRLRGALPRRGESLGVCWKETQYILHPACEERTLFGRL